MKRQIINRKIEEKRSIIFNIEYNDWTMRNVIISEGDKVTVVFLVNGLYNEEYGRISKITAIESAIRTPFHPPSIIFNMTLDISKDFISNTIDICTTDIYDIYIGEPGSVPPEDSPNKPSDNPPIGDPDDPPIIVPLPDEDEPTKPEEPIPDESLDNEDDKLLDEEEENNTNPIVKFFSWLISANNKTKNIEKDKKYRRFDPDNLLAPIIIDSKYSKAVPTKKGGVFYYGGR